MDNGYQHFIVNYVFENRRQLAILQEAINKETVQKIHSFLLTCQREEQLQRLRARNNDQLLWELDRSAELNEILHHAFEQDNDIIKIDTTAQFIEKISQHILNLTYKT